MDNIVGSVYHERYSRKVKQSMNRVVFEIFATWFYCGRIKKAPGTWGSIASLPVAYLVFGRFFIGMIFIICLCAVGYFCVRGYLKQASSDDPKEVVIDEVVGQVLTVYLVSFANKFIFGANIPGFYAVFFVSLLFFRLFDILKMWPISFIDRNVKGAAGVIFDDLLASVFAAVFSSAFFVLIHKYYHL